MPGRCRTVAPPPNAAVARDVIALLAAYRAGGALDVASVASGYVSVLSGGQSGSAVSLLLGLLRLTDGLLGEVAAFRGLAAGDLLNEIALEVAAAGLES